MHPVGFSAFNCLLDSQCSLLTSQILGSCSKLKWSNRAYAVYWLRGTLLYPCPLIKKNVINTPVILTPSAAITGPVIIFSRHQFSRHTRWGHGTATVQDCCSVSLGEPALTPLKATEFTSMNMDLDKVTISRWSLAEVAWGGEQVHRGQDLHVVL